MHVITISQVREKAREFQQERQSWHFHVLEPDCVLNEGNGQYAFVLECRSSGQTYVSYLDCGFAEIAQELLKLHYGDDILEKPASDQSQSLPASKLLNKCEELRKNHVPWHHHMLFPDCIFNTHSGKWNVVLESSESGLYINELYDEEPLDVLRQLEIGYFAGNLPDFQD